MSLTAEQREAVMTALGHLSIGDVADRLGQFVADYLVDLVGQA